MTSFLHGKISHIPTNYSMAPCSPTLFENPQNHGASERDPPQCQVQPKEEMKTHSEMEGSSDHQQLVSVNSNNNCYDNHVINHSLSYHYVREESAHQHESVKWMPSKVRIMRKIMNSGHHTTKIPRRRHHQPEDQKQLPSQESSNEKFHGGIIRVCSACKTTKTPLWRSGPCGPKSLCNACGIRQRKARRAMAAATAMNGRLVPVAVGKSAKEKGFVDVDCSVPFKKRCRFTSAHEIAQRKLCFEDTVFPQDEKDAAILLMALSCGLICS